MKRVINNKLVQVFLTSLLLNHANLFSSDEFKSFNPNLPIYNYVANTANEED